MAEIHLKLIDIATDAAKAIHSAFDRAPWGSVFIIPDGQWPCDNRIELLGKDFRVVADGASLYPSSKYIDDGKPFFTYGTQNPAKEFCQEQRLCGIKLLPGRNPPNIGLRMLNANFSMIDRVKIIGFDTPFQQYVSEGMYSFRNTLRDCFARYAVNAFRQNGIAGLDGLMATGTTLENFTCEDSPNLECLLDFEGQNNTAVNVWVQGGKNPCLLRAGGAGRHRVEFQYFGEGYPATIEFKSNSNLVDTRGRNYGEWTVNSGINYNGNVVM